MGNLETDNSGVAERGLLIRHLVLPGDLGGTRKICEFMADKMSPEAKINIMDHYRACADAFKNPPLDRRLYRVEFMLALEWVKMAGLKKVMQFGSHS